MSPHQSFEGVEMAGGEAMPADIGHWSPCAQQYYTYLDEASLSYLR